MNDDRFGIGQRFRNVLQCFVEISPFFFHFINEYEGRHLEFRCKVPRLLRLHPDAVQRINDKQGDIGTLHTILGFGKEVLVTWSINNIDGVFFPFELMEAATDAGLTLQFLRFEIQERVAIFDTTNAIG